jgi:integrase
MTSILSRVREYFPNEYDKIATLNNDLSKKYQRERDTNDAPDDVIDKLISFDPKYIEKLLIGITNINDKALMAVYTLTPPRRIMDYRLMKITFKKKDDKTLNHQYNYITFENGIPDLFVFFNHKTKKSQPNPNITIPTELATILNNYIHINDMVQNDFLFGTEPSDFKKEYTQPHFTEKLQKTFLKYTGKKISVNLIRSSKSTHLDNEGIILAEIKKIATQMGHSLMTNMQYSKNMGVKRQNKQPTSEPAIIKQPTIKRNTKRSTTKIIDYNENKK